MGKKRPARAVRKTPEEVAAEAVRKAEQDRAWHQAEVRAARAIQLQALGLLGEDVPNGRPPRWSSGRA